MTKDEALKKQIDNLWKAIWFLYFFAVGIFLLDFV
jgi:hypothetical protein